MSKPVLTYFDFPGGRGEDCRIALHAAGVEFTDERINPKTWSERKASTPFGRLPAFSHKGVSVGGSNPILSLIGRENGLHPTDPLQAARHEGIMDEVEAIRAYLFPTVRPPEEEREAQRTEYANGPLQQAFSNLSDQISGPFVAGEDLSVADLKVFILLRFFRSGNYDFVPTTIFDDHPKLVALFEAVSAHNAVTSWYAK